MTNSEINYNAGAQHRAQIFNEINAHPINVDRASFNKSASERKELKEAKTEQGRNHKFQTWIRFGADDTFVNPQINARYGIK